MTKDEALKLSLSALDEVRQETFRLMRDGQTLYAEKKVWEAIYTIKKVLAQPKQCQCPNCRVTLHASDCAVHSGPAYPAGGCDCGAQQGPEFFTHNVEQPYDWSEWVCPDPKGYLMKCCDCGLVHEAEFGVVRYKSETEREDCDRVDDPNLQAVFRMRRSEQWSPEDTAHRAGGLPMEQSSQQEPVAWMHTNAIGHVYFRKNPQDKTLNPVPLYTTPPQRTWVGLTYEEKHAIRYSHMTSAEFIEVIEAKLKDKNT